MYFLVGYVGIYGLYFIFGSYTLLVVSMTAHPAQFACLPVFENRRTYSSVLPSNCSPFYPCRYRTALRRRKFLGECKPVLLPAAQCLAPPPPRRSNVVVLDRSYPPLVLELLRKRQSSPKDPNNRIITESSGNDVAGVDTHPTNQSHRE